MRKQELMRYLGSMQQVAYVRPVSYKEGRSKDLGAVELKNGPLLLTALTDKCLDISSVSYKGINFNFLSKPGLQGLGHYDTNGDEAIRSIMCGFLFTSGLENICAPCRIDDVDYPMHGRMRSTPGEHICTDAVWEGDEYVLTVQAEMREAALFGENLTLRRTIRTVYGSNSFSLVDEFENEAFRDEPLMLLYHINMGYPFLNEHTRIYIPTRKVTARDQAGIGHEAAYDRMDPPIDNETEYVFIHELNAEPDGMISVAVVNEELELGIEIRYHSGNLPYFMEWKTVASGDYALGLEPANSNVFGRPWHEQRGDVHKIAPFAKERNELIFSILDGREDIRKAINRIQGSNPFIQ